MEATYNEFSKGNINNTRQGVLVALGIVGRQEGRDECFEGREGTSLVNTAASFNQTLKDKEIRQGNGLVGNAVELRRKLDDQRHRGRLA